MHGMLPALKRGAIVTDVGSVNIPLGASSTYEFRLGQGGIPAGSKFVRAQLLGTDGQSARQQACDPLLGRLQYIPLDCAACFRAW